MPHLHRKVPRRAPKRATRASPVPYKYYACHAKRRRMSESATPAPQNEGECQQGGRLPRETKVDALTTPKKRRNSTRLPQFLSLTDNAENETSLRDFINFRSWQHQKRSNSARLPSKIESPGLTATYQCDLRFFHSTCLKYCACACHEKLMPGHTKCCTYHAKSS